MKGMQTGICSVTTVRLAEPAWYNGEHMADKATLELIQDDIQSIKSQIDILRMETRALQLEPLAYLLDLALQQIRNSEFSDTDLDTHSSDPLAMQ